MKTGWNSGMHYSFSEIRAMMWILGVWPLQQNHLACTLRWVIIFIAESLTMLNLLIEPFKECGDAKDTLEVFLIIEAATHAWLNVVFARVSMKKIASNVSAAIDDWSSSTKGTESHAIMMGYARISRIITISHLAIGTTAALLYFTSVFVGNKEQIVTIGNDTVTLWNFVMPATCLFKGISYSTYKALFAMQILQAFIIYVAECASDSFFFAITMHLCGQVEILRNRFVDLERQIDEKHNHRAVLGSWIRRHYKLITLARNIEEVFSINILLRLSILTIVIAVSGLRILVSAKYHDYTDVVKSMVFIQYSIVQSFLFTHAGESLQNHSEAIVSTIYSTTWHEWPSNATRDLILIMMRTKIPLRLSAGKFFYITRKTLADILKTALTYISFLRVTMEN